MAYKGNLVYDQTDRPMNRETGPDSGWTGEWCDVPIGLQNADVCLTDEALVDPVLISSHEGLCQRCSRARVFKRTGKAARQYIASGAMA